MSSDHQVLAIKQKLVLMRKERDQAREELQTALGELKRLKEALDRRARPAVEIRQVNDGFALYEAERLVRGGFDRAHTARLWALDQGLEIKV